ncbi:hypothetical protein B0H17DRAFT_1099615 [Mycena rosella]|uniref:Apple domain-containing protein n=1 Tax=Mycena rosella TaxID=1033263 RepID=A0AAD7CND7_MYCRO|nr:hypothetical protein B0H17DRAFT_1099615 [Mycena rosella]
MPSPSLLLALAALVVSASATSYTGEFHNIFSGAGVGVPDAAVEDNSNYINLPSVAACQDWCVNSVPNCAFVNLYYEFWNPLFDFVYSEKSNLVCAAYKVVESVDMKTGYGGQTLYSQVGDTPAPTTYRTQSSGWALDKIDYTDTPAGYTKVFGPTNGANNAPGYMGYTALGSYDIAACAALCDARAPDSTGGYCAYFNIWRAVTSGSTSGFTCSFYYTAATAATAVNYGQGDLAVTLSRGYARSDTPAYTPPPPPAYSRRAVPRATPTLAPHGRRLRQAAIRPCAAASLDSRGLQKRGAGTLCIRS